MSMEIQNKIRQNAIEMRECVSDLYEWEQEMELKQKARAKVRENERQIDEEAFKMAKEEEIRENKRREEKEIEEAKIEKEKKRADLVRDSNTIKNYYNAWDKFDADKVLKKMEEEE